MIECLHRYPTWALIIACAAAYPDDGRALSAAERIEVCVGGYSDDREDLPEGDAIYEVIGDLDRVDWDALAEYLVDRLAVAAFMPSRSSSRPRDSLATELG